MTSLESNLSTVIKELQDLISESIRIPIGTVQHFATETAPDGWLKADGVAVSRTEYADLFAAIGTTFGEGDGSTTFNVPDLQDKFVLGLGSTYATIAATGGEVEHTLTTSEMPSHSHTYSTLSEAMPQSGSATLCWHGSATASTASTGGDGAHNNMPPYVVLNYCIKY